MNIKTRKLPATTQEGERMRASATNVTATLTIAFPYASNDPHRQAAFMLAKAYGYTDVEHIQGHAYRAVRGS